MKKQNDKKTDNHEVVVDQETFQKLQNDFNALQIKFDELTHQLKRAVADYQNLEKRVIEGRIELSRWATEELVKKILPVLEHFDKALNGVSDEEKKSGWLRGVELAMQQLRGVLKDEGLEEIAADGQFDPALHEAVDTREGEDNKILEVAEKGYKLSGKVVKPTKVVVGKKGIDT